jgi:hypothetical protein
MIAISARYARWLILVLGAALLPILAEAIRPRQHDDCRNPDMLTLTLAIPGSKPASAGRRGARAERSRPAGDFTLWTQGEIENPEDARNALRFWIVRSFDPGAASPRRILHDAFDPESHELREMSTDVGAAPIHVAIDRTRDPGRVVAWMHAYDGRPTSAVFPELLQASAKRLATGAVPVTLFLVDGITTEPDTSAVEAAATRWIADAWTHMVRYCR